MSNAVLDVRRVVDQALIDELDSRRGVAQEGSRRLLVTEALIRRYAHAIGEADPVHLDPAVARSRGYAGLLAPPTMLTALMNWTEDSGRHVREDGYSFDDDLPGVDLEDLRIMGGGEHVRLLEPVVAGQVVTRTSTLRSVTAKSGSTGRFAILEFETAYRDGSGRLLVESTKKVLVR